MDKRAIIYLRVSTSRQAKKDLEPEGLSLPAQRDACRGKAKSLGAEVVNEFVDRGESARSADRPELIRMLAFLKEAPEIDYVIVAKVDRLARNLSDHVGISVAIKNAGVQLISVSENIDDTPTGRLIDGVMASFAEYYSRNLAVELPPLVFFVGCPKYLVRRLRT